MTDQTPILQAPQAPPAVPDRRHINRFPAQRCGYIKPDGKKCNAVANKGTDRCHWHSPGFALSLPDEKTPQRYRTSLPTRLIKKFDAGITDPEMLTLRSDIAVIGARIEELLEKSNGVESETAWKRAGESILELRRAISMGSPVLLAKAVNELESAINDGNTDADLWREIRATIHDRRILVESERKRLIELGSVMTAAQALAFVNALVEIIRDNVTDIDALQRITVAITSLVDIPEDGEQERIVNATFSASKA